MALSDILNTPSKYIFRNRDGVIMCFAYRFQPGRYPCLIVDKFRHEICVNITELHSVSLEHGRLSLQLNTKCLKIEASLSKYFNHCFNKVLSATLYKVEITQVKVFNGYHLIHCSYVFQWTANPVLAVQHPLGRRNIITLQGLRV